MPSADLTRNVSEAFPQMTIEIAHLRPQKKARRYKVQFPSRQDLIFANQQCFIGQCRQMQTLASTVQPLDWLPNLML